MELAAMTLQPAGTAAGEHEGFVENINVVDTVINSENLIEIYDTYKIVGLSDAVQNLTPKLPLTTIHGIRYNDTAGTAADEHEGFLQKISVVDTVVSPENPLEIYDTDKIGLGCSLELNNFNDNTDLKLPIDNDPAKLSKIVKFSYNLKKLVLNKGPCQPDYKSMPNIHFSVTNGRHFRPEWFLYLNCSKKNYLRHWQ